MKYRIPIRVLATGLLITLHTMLLSQEKKALTITDMMKFRQLESPAISEDGRWVVHTARPDRGDPEVLVYSTSGDRKYSIILGEKPVLSRDGKWVACKEAVSPEVLFKSKKGKDKENGPKPGMVLLNTENGKQEVSANVHSFSFSQNSQWLLYHHVPLDSKLKTGTELVLKSLKDTTELRFDFVKMYALDSTANHLAFTVSDTTNTNNGIYVVDLEAPGELLPLYVDSTSWANNLVWNNQTGQLVFLAGTKDKKDKANKHETSLLGWTPGSDKADTLLSNADVDPRWRLYHSNSLKWSEDGQRLFLGLKPLTEILPEEEEKQDSLKDFYGHEDILAERGVDVWHWNDPFINTHQKKMWKQVKDRTYTAVYTPEDGRLVQLGDPEVTDVRIMDNSLRLLASTNVPYAREMTWVGRIRDYYLVDLGTGEKTKVLEAQQHSVSLSPDGKKLVWYRDGDWYIMDAGSLEQRKLNHGMDVPFANEDWDYPADVPGYGVAGWVDGSEAVMIHDKFDIWLFPSRGGAATSLTEGQGREGLYSFRIENLDPDKKYYKNKEKVLLTAYHDSLKHTAVFSMKIGSPGVKLVLEEEKTFQLLARAKEADQIIYSRESYTEFPDLWVTDSKFRKPAKLTDVNPQVEDFAWGKARLVEWSSMDGKPIQGILITPDSHKEGDKLPVLVYYYRFFTDRLHTFNHVAVNHRPCFPYYASNGYAVFLPDIRFDVGNPGYAATKCLVPGVQKIIDMGIADPDAICLHGHSWSGYQTAFVITQTDMFTCAIAGAPVSNMTSAYSGIRWESGLARQFQYEQSQSRIGGSLWEARDKYIENSPVFFADRIHTPLLIQFGDADEKVPWYQGIELYLAMRRLDKDCIFLQYRNEPHHLKQYANKLDYTLKFKQYLDHYLKGEPAADWIKEGVPYQGK